MKNREEVRWDRVREARRKIARGHYDDPRWLERLARILAREVSKAE